jgi:hypothetical protein
VEIFNGNFSIPRAALFQFPTCVETASIGTARATALDVGNADFCGPPARKRIHHRQIFCVDGCYIFFSRRIATETAPKQKQNSQGGHATFYISSRYFHLRASGESECFVEQRAIVLTADNDVVAGAWGQRIRRHDQGLIPLDETIGIVGVCEGREQGDAATRPGYSDRIHYQCLPCGDLDENGLANGICRQVASHDGARRLGVYRVCGAGDAIARIR